VTQYGAELSHNRVVNRHANVEGATPDKALSDAERSKIRRHYQMPNGVTSVQPLTPTVERWEILFTVWSPYGGVNSPGDLDFDPCFLNGTSGSNNNFNQN